MELAAEAIKARLTASLKAAGAIAVGIADAAPVEDSLNIGFDRWIEEGGHASMLWIERHRELRRDPANVLEGVKSVVSIAFPYFREIRRDASLPRIAMYAYGADYHNAIRKKLKPICAEAEELTGGKTRVCVDSAPLPERYWAMKAGIGRKCDNGTVIIDGYGSFVFLCEILTDFHLPPDTPSTRECSHCGRCVAACPGKAIGPDATVSCRRCLSYLTIERDPDEPLPPESRRVLESPDGVAMLCGCDICQLVCPHNANLLNALPGSLPKPVTESLTRVLVLDPTHLSAEQWDEITCGTSLRRALKLIKSKYRLD